MKLFYRITSILLCITLMVISVPVYVLAAVDNENYKLTEQANREIVIGEPSDYSTDSLDAESLKVRGKGEKSLKELKEIDISKIEFPKFISKDKALSRGHVNRLKEQESDLNTVIYQNRDGSKTAYIFNKPVKYIDENGNVKDKDTALSNIDHEVYSYAMVNNSVKAFFPNNISNGALIEYNKYGVKMTPVSHTLQKSSTGASLVQTLDDIILYEKVFGDNIDLRYTMLLYGVKEDIIINKYDGQTQFQFVVEAEGLTAKLNSNGYWQLFDNDIPVITFEKIIVKDNNGKTIIGSMNIEYDDSKNIIMTIEVPQSFLLDPTTAYPVCVDPTAYIWETSYVYDYESGYEEERSSIIDVGLYASYDDYVMADGSTVLELGTSYYDVSKIIYKFPDFYDGDYGAYIWLNQYNIGSAILNVEFLSASSVTVNANPMTDTYSDDTDPWQIYDPDLIYSYSTINGSSTYISSAGIKQIDITDIVKGWARYNSGETTASYCNPENGLLLSLEEEYDYAAVASTRYDYSDNVYLELEYSYTGGEYYVYNLNEYKFLRNNTSNGLSLNSYSTANTQKWIFEYLGEDQFYIRSAYNPDYVLYGSGSSVSLTTLPTSPSNNYKWYINTASGGGVIIKNCYSNYVLHVNGTSLNLISQPTSGTTAYNLCRWGILETSEYIGLTNISLSDDWIKTGTSKYLNIRATPSNASWRSANFFTWTISDTSKINYTDSNGKFSGVSSGKVTLTLTNKLTGFSRSFTIACGTIREGQYMILNKGSGNYMDVEGPSMSSGAYIQQWEYHTGNQAKWNVMLMSNGDYVIQSVYSQKYLRVEDGSSSSGAAIIQFENYSWTSTRWKIEETASGAYKIVPMLVSNFAVKVPSNSSSNGVNLVQQAYTNDTNYYDEWIFDNIGETHGIDNGEVYTIKATHSNKVVTATNGTTNNGTNISQYALTPGHQWQRWKFLYLGNGEYKIQDMNSGKLLSISASSSSNRANAQLWYDDGTTGQIFKIKENTDGTYTFLSKCSYYIYALTVADSNMSDNANIYQYSNTGSSNQKFQINKSVADINYIAPVLTDLFNYASTYKPNYSNKKKQLLVLQYIRHNTNYVEGNWIDVAGEIDEDFIAYVNNQNSFMATIFSGVKNDNDIAGNSAGAFIYDYEGNKIDFYHLCAVLSGLIYNTTVLDTFKSLIGEAHIDNLCGWAGDLQQLIVDDILPSINNNDNYDVVYNKTLELMGESDSSFSMEDLFADTDAYNIYRSIDYSNLSETFVTYYSWGYNERYSKFTNNWSKVEIYNCVRAYTTHISPVGITWPLFGGATTTSTQADAIAQAFTDFIWERICNE